MKGKFKLGYKIIAAVVIFITAILCMGIGYQIPNNKITVHAWADKNGEEFSTLADGDVVLSVERVSLESSSGTSVKTFYKRDNSQIYFSNIVEDNKNKQVVEDGQFVMLNNKFDNNNYVNETTGKSDAIIISFGQYVLKGEEVKETLEANAMVSSPNTVKDIDYAQITYLTVDMFRNGVKFNNLEIRDTISSFGLFHDFVYVIEEDGSDIEGHYEMTFNYIKGGKEYTADFDFFLVCKTSYTKTKEIGGQTYYAAPNLGWVGTNEQYAEAVAGEDGYIHYYEGKNGINTNTNEDAVGTISYPTLTYDYTKYQVSYKHTTKRTVTNYNLNYQIKSNGEVELVVSSTGGINDEKYFPLNNYNKNISLVTIVFTEQGDYDISFKYLYTGGDIANAPNMDKLKIENKKLSIHGADLNYSKEGYSSAQFRKFKFSQNREAEVCLIVPNGYKAGDNIEKYKNNALSLLYSVDKTNYSVGDKTKQIRVGQIIVPTDEDVEKRKDRTEDTLQNYKIGSSADIAELATNIKDTSAYTKLSATDPYSSSAFNLDSYKFEYVKSNQGSMWLSYQDEIDASESFYFYSRKEFTEDSFVEKNEHGIKSAAKPYNNQVSFNQVGYYLVFLKLKAEGGYYQVYAFQYASSTIDIDIVEAKENGKTIGAGKYTTENVIVSWKDTETFESEIVGYYYKAVGYNFNQKEMLTNASAVKLNTNKGVELGGVNNEFVRYLIKLERAGESATYKLFTIDREAISGVNSYVVKTRSIGNSSVYYVIDTDKYNQEKIIRNQITDSFATLIWDKKASGATISATYSYTPFVKDTTLTPTGTINNNWLATNYKLGETLDGFSLTEVNSRNNVEHNSVLFNQGIYIFTIIDEAGNACKYMLVVDKTEAFLQIQDEAGNPVEILTNAYGLYGDNIRYTAGTHKVINLGLTINASSSDAKKELYNVINAAVNNNLAAYENNKTKFYAEDNSLSINKLQELFGEFGGSNYVTVRNERVVAYDGFIVDDGCSSLQNSTNGFIKFDRENLNGATSLRRTLYVVGANNTYSSVFDEARDSKSYVDIEINKDNSLGMSYFSNTEFEKNNVPTNGGDSDAVKRLATGSDLLDGSNIVISGVNGAEATKDRYVGFTWLYGEGTFEVGTIEYRYYTLETSYQDNNKYFYKLNGNTTTIYNFATDVKTGDRGFHLFKTNYDGTTKEGLYEVIRKYKDPYGDYGEDTYELNYYFIVDRNGIIDFSKGKEIGKNIEIELMKESSLAGANFNLISSTSHDLRYTDGNTRVEESFYIYFTTNKVPAVLNIPTGKYTTDNGENILNSSRAYKAGQLRFSVYYRDIYKQISNMGEFETFKIYEDNIADEAELYNIDFYTYLTNQGLYNLRDKLIATSNNKNWLNLQGVYVIVIEDNVKSSSGVINKKLIGFEIIEEKYPETDIYIGGSKDQMGETTPSKVANGKYEVVTNQEFVKVELPAYRDINGEKVINAQVDPNYLHITQTFGSKEITYVSYDYSYTGASGKLESGENGIQFIYLETFLKDASGRILTEYFNIPLSYTITIRYKVGNLTNHTQFADCYYYYNLASDDPSEKVYYYTSTYTVIIDRLAPTINVEQNLKGTDVLIQSEYVDVEFESGFYEESKAYFTYQYADYYRNGKKLEDIYAFRVTDKTPFDNTEVESLYYKAIDVSQLTSLTLNLPLITNLGTSVNMGSEIVEYGNIFAEKYGYYHILEMDKAGNMTQYVVYYTNAQDESLIIPMSYQGTNGQTPTIEIGDKESAVKNIQIFEINALGSSVLPTDYFHYVSLTAMSNLEEWEDLSIVTNFATQHGLSTTSIGSLIANKISGRRGNYNLTIVSRAGDAYRLGISVYSEEDKIRLDIQDLIVIENGKYFIDLDAANREVGGVLYYAKEITVTEKLEDLTEKSTTYFFELDGFKYYYVNDLEEKVYLNDAGNRLVCAENATYKLKLTDVFEQTSNTRFNTAGKEFYKITFADPGNYYVDEEGYYYGFTEASIDFDVILKLVTSDVTVTLNGNRITNLKEIEKYVSIKNQTVTITPEMDAVTGKGGLLVVNMQFRETDNTPDREFKITIDTTTQPVSLKDYASSESKNMQVFLNKDISDVENLRNYTSKDTTSGIMNLSWAEENKDNYIYDYLLYELLKDDTFVSHDLELVTNRVIDTANESTGLYWFIIVVKAVDGTVLGNKIYAFDVQQMNNQLYYVKNSDEVALNPNASFKATELSGIEFYLSSITGVKADLPTTIPTTNLPLYVANEELNVVLTENIKGITIFAANLTNGNILYLYEINAATYNVYMGILVVKETEALVENVKIGETDLGDKELVTFATSDPSKEYVLTADRIEAPTGFLAKNTLLLDIYYNDIFVKTVVYKEAVEPYVNYSIYGNGNYSFVFKDLAGNKHKFVNDTNRIDVMILREVVVTLNDQMPVDSIYYNGEVTLKVFASTKYVTGSISVSALRNGEPYTTSYSNPYIFKDFGTYIVNISANYKDEEGAIIRLARTVKFTILNVKEVKNSIDLTNMSKFKIVKVLNQNNDDVTTAFTTLLNNKPNAMLLTYEDIMNNSKDLKVSAGKNTFTVEYLVPADLYPEQNVQVQFTLNDEKPVVNCSLNAGDSTTEGFDITFNPGILFEQIGESYIYINNEVAYEINEKSTLDIVTLSTTFESNGAGDFYVKLVGSSGNVWQSFKVRIKEPLNAGAIIIIVVVVAVVATVVITIIVLRRKMRIR